MSAAAADQEPETLKIDIRPANGADVPWIYSSWLRSHREHGSGVGTIPRDAYYREHRKRLLAVTSRPGVMTLVACAAENNEQIFGWLCGARDITCGPVRYDAVWYYGHVKSERRRQGIMRALCGAFGITTESRCAYTHKGRLSWVQDGRPKTEQLAAIVPPGWDFVPYLFFT